MTELLIPAGNFDKLKVAVLYGADAVYLSGEKFSLRSGSDNFSLSELEMAVKYAHERDCRVYVTINAFLLDKDFEHFPAYVQFLDRIEVDAVICSDLGVISTIQQYSNLRIHVSTQASVINSEHAKVWKSFGVKRIVLGREVSALEASKIKKETGLEVEIFVHGAMCMSYSGHCTISNYTAGRDSNRGGCIQSCRHEYVVDNNGSQQNEFLMSSKDLYGLHLIPKICDYEIDSLKVEGRMKSFLYVASTARAYSEILRSKLNNQNTDFQAWNDELKKIPHRDYTSGFLEQEADETSIYNGDRSSYNNYKLAGMVLEYDEASQTSYFQCLQKLHASQNIELLQKGMTTTTIALDKMQDFNKNIIQKAAPGDIIQFQSQPVEAFSVARLNTSE